MICFSNPFSTRSISPPKDFFLLSKLPKGHHLDLKENPASKTDAKLVGHQQEEVGQQKSKIPNSWIPSSRHALETQSQSWPINYTEHIQWAFTVSHCPPRFLMCHLKLWHTISECWTNFSAMLQNATFFGGGSIRNEAFRRRREVTWRSFLRKDVTFSLCFSEPCLAQPPRCDEWGFSCVSLTNEKELRGRWLFFAAL